MSPRSELRNILLVEEHPVRNRLYRKCISELGCAVLGPEDALWTTVPQIYAVAVVSIPENPEVYGEYKKLLRALPAHVPCVALTAGSLPSLFTGFLQLVRHINRAETHPQELVYILKSIIRA